jgi:tetratricopeptide (TPR) repeat protein
MDKPCFKHNACAKKSGAQRSILCLAMLLAALMLLSACSGNNSGGGSDPTGTAQVNETDPTSTAAGRPGAGSDPMEAMQIASKDALEFMGNFEIAMNQFRKHSEEYSEVGMFLQANWFDSMGASCACSLRFYIDRIIEWKGGTVPPDEKARLSDWDAIGSLNMASPFAWAFESFALRAEGKDAGAEKAWANAVANPLMVEEFKDTAALFEALSIGELLTARAQAAAQEDILLDAAGSYRPPFERVSGGWSDVYYLEKGNEVLKADETDFAGALSWYRAALAVDPFDPQNFYACAQMHMEMDEVMEMFYYLEEGLRIAPDDERLNTLLAVLIKVGESL